jgi:hypothetical protein
MGLLFPEGEHRGKVVDGNGVCRRPTRYRGDSLLGSRSGGKSTVDALYLAPAIKQGLKVLDMHEATSLCAMDGGGYRLEARNHRLGRNVWLTAPVVVLAAGTMNTVRLLFRSRAQAGLRGMRTLGERFGTNGDCAARWELGDPSRDFSRGPSCHGRVAIKGEPADEAYFVLGGFRVPRLPRWVPARLRRPIESQRHNLLMIGMGPDAGDGRFGYAKGRLTVRYSRRNSPIFEHIQKAFRTVERLSGRPVRYGKHAVTVHPYGGAVIGPDAAKGVVDGGGEVFGHAGLFVADASAFPKAPGGPPSLNVSAWASHVAQRICERYPPTGCTETLTDGEVLAGPRLSAPRAVVESDGNGAAHPEIRAAEPARNRRFWGRQLHALTFRELDAVFAGLPNPRALSIEGAFWGRLLVTRGISWLPPVLRRWLVGLLERVLLSRWKGKWFSQAEGINLFRSRDNPKRSLPFELRLANARDGSGQVIRLNYDIDPNPARLRPILGEARPLNDREILARMYFGDTNWIYYLLER